MPLLELEPLEATKQLLDISVTERGQFRQCRRRWNLNTLENLQPKDSDPMPLVFGTGIHNALEIYYKGGGVEAALESWTDWRNIQESECSNEDYETVFDLGELGETMLRNYFEYDGVAKVQVGRPLAVEGELLTNELEPCGPKGYALDALPWIHESGRLMVPIVDPISKNPIFDKDGRIPHLTMRLDLLTERKTPKKGVWVNDHKTFATPPSDKILDLDDQATGYCYGVYRWLGIVPRGIIWDVLLKNAPKEPRIVNDRRKGHKGDLTLSAAKDQLTLPSMYREALKEWGYMSGGTINSKDHADCLSALLARGWDPFFRRYELTRNMHELESFEHRLIQEYWDMLDSYDDAARLYHNPSMFHCPGCPVQRACLAMEDGSDWEDVLDRHFEVGPDRKATVK